MIPAPGGLLPKIGGMACVSIALSIRGTAIQPVKKADEAEDHDDGDRPGGPRHDGYTVPRLQ